MGEEKDVAYRFLVVVALVGFSATPLFAVEFLPRVSFPINGSALGVEHGDFDGDGLLDVVVGNSQFLNEYIFFGQSNGTLGSPIIIQNRIDSVRALAAGDFNRDGRDDFVYNEGDDLAVRYGRSDNSFSDLALFPGGGSTTAMVTLDMDGDGFLDLVKSSQWTNRMNILYGLGDGTFAPTIGFSTGGGSSPRGVAAADYNADGYTDVAVSNFFHDEIAVYFGSADRTVFTRVNYPTPAPRPEGIVAGDFNRDGLPDIAYTTRPRNAVEIMLSLPGGGFTTPTRFTVSDNPMSIDFGDFNGDSILDLATSDGANAVSVLIGVGDGTFTRLPDMLASANGSSAIDVADLDGNGLDDILVTAGSGSYLDIFYAVPEPSCMALFALGGTILLQRRTVSMRSKLIG